MWDADVQYRVNLFIYLFISLKIKLAKIAMVRKKIEKICSAILLIVASNTIQIVSILHPL
jgi:hypothetical protein